MSIHNANTASRLVRASSLSGSCAIVAVAFLVSGCIDPIALIEPGAGDPAGERVAGVSLERLQPNVATEFEVDVPIDRRLEIIAEPGGGATLGIGPVSAPDGQAFSAQPGATARSKDDAFQVQARGFGDLGVGLHFLGQSPTSGRWKFALVARPAQFAALRESARTASILENLLLAGYILSGGLGGREPAPETLRWFYPELADFKAPIDVTLRINLLAPGDSPAFPPAGGSTDPNATPDPNSGGPTDPNDSSGNPQEPTVPNTPIAGATVELVVQSGDAVPGQPGATFTWLSNPLVDSKGRVAFWGAYDGGSGSAGLYVWSNGALSRVIDGDPNAVGSAPGLDSGSYFGDIRVQYDGFSPHLSWASADRLIFAAATNGSPLPNGLFRYRLSDGHMLQILDCDDFRALFSNVGDTFLCEFFNPVVSDDGYAIFTNRYTYFKTDQTFVFRNRGLFFSNGIETQAMLAPEFPRAVPGVASATFTDVELLPAMNYGIDVVLQASFSTPTGSGDHGVYRYTGGQLFRLIDNGTGRTWTGLPSGSVVGEAGKRFERVAVGPLRHVAIDTTITGADNVKRNSVILYGRNRWTEIRPNGLAASDLLTSVNEDGHLVVLAGGKPYLWNGTTAVDLTADLPAQLAGQGLTWSTFGGSINNAGHALLRYTRGGKPGLALWTGDKLVVVADASLGLPAATFDELLSGELPSLDNMDRSGVVKDRPEVDRVGRSSAINDSATFVFRVGTPGIDLERNTADDYQAIYIGRGQ
jgi:hypothetical protein